MSQLQSGQHQAVYVKSIKANHIPVVYTQLKMISGRHLGLTYKSIWELHIKTFTNDMKGKV